MTQTPVPRILCVEDNQDISGYINNMLKIAGYQTVIAQNLIDGLQLAKNEHFDLILLDHDLPDGTGLELCKLIRALDTHTPILFFSNAIGPRVRQEAIAAGAQGYISKMEAFDILEQAISKLIESTDVKGFAPLSPADEVSTKMFPQQDFDRFVERYNADFHFLLLRAGTGQFDCLLTSFLVLKDLYATIIKLHEISNLELRIIPYPISLRASEQLLEDLGFNEEEMERIRGFLQFIRETQGKEFEAILDEGLMVHCIKRDDAVQPSV